MIGNSIRNWQPCPEPIATIGMVDPWPAPAEAAPTPTFATSRAGRTLLTCIVLAGLQISGFLGWLTWEWFRSDADEAPIVFVPLFAMTLGVLSAAVVLPAAMLIRGLRRRS